MESSLELESLTKEVVGGLGSGLVGLHSKGRLTVICLLSQEINWLALKGTVLLGSAGPQISKHQNTKIKDMVNAFARTCCFIQSLEKTCS